MALSVGRDSMSPVAAPEAANSQFSDDTRPSLSRPGLAVAALAGALPGLTHAALGGALLVDDYGFLRRTSELWAQSVDRFSRPIQWGVHLVQFELLGDRAWAHALVMAVAGATVAVLLALAVNANIGRRAAVPVAVVWALYPATSTIRYWNSTVPLLVALGCLAGAWYLSAGRDTPSWAVTGLLVGATLSYESGLFLALAVFALPLWRRRGWDPAIVPHGVVLGAAIALNRLTSPKGEVRVDPLGSLGDIPVALFGPSLAPRALDPLWVLFLLLPIVAAALRVTRGPSSADRDLALGAGAIALGMAVMIGIAFPLVPVGLLDRGNAMAGPGVAILLVAATIAIGERFGDKVGRVLLGVVAVAFLASTLEIGASVRQAEDDLRTAIAAADELDGVVAVEVPVRSGYAAVTQTWSLAPATLVLGSDAEVVSTDDHDPSEADWLVVVGTDGAATVEATVRG